MKSQSSHVSHPCSIPISNPSQQRGVQVNKPVHQPELHWESATQAGVTEVSADEEHTRHFSASAALGIGCHVHCACLLVGIVLYTDHVETGKPHASPLLLLQQHSVQCIELLHQPIPEWVSAIHIVESEVAAGK